MTTPNKEKMADYKRRLAALGLELTNEADFDITSMIITVGDFFSQLLRTVFHDPDARRRVIEKWVALTMDEDPDA